MELITWWEKKTITHEPDEKLVWGWTLLTVTKGWLYRTHCQITWVSCYMMSQCDEIKTALKTIWQVMRKVEKGRKPFDKFIKLPASTTPNDSSDKCKTVWYKDIKPKQGNVRISLVCIKKTFNPIIRINVGMFLQNQRYVETSLWSQHCVCALVRCRHNKNMVRVRKKHHHLA